MIVGSFALEKGIRAEFNKTFGALMGTFEEAKALNQIATIVPSTHSSEKYGFFGDMPDVKEWIGDQTDGALTDYSYTLVNKHWYTNFAVDTDELADDEGGFIKTRTQFLAQALLGHEFESVSDLFTNNGVCYDAAAFFYDSRSGCDNIHTATITSTAAGIKADVYTAYGMMREFKDIGNVRSIHALPDTALVPAEMAGLVMEVVYQNSTPGGSNQGFNPINQWIKNVAVSPYLTTADDYYLLDTSKPLKPVFLQMRQAPEVKVDDTYVKRNRKMIVRGDGRYRAGYALPQLAIKIG